MGQTDVTRERWNSAGGKTAGVIKREGKGEKPNELIRFIFAYM
jgi:hypothetical protein